MARNSALTVITQQEKNDFVLALYRQQPELSRSEAMEAFREKFGAPINPRTLNQLREEALASAPAPAPTAPAAEVVEVEAAADEAPAKSETNGAGPGRKPKAKGGGKNIFLEATPEQLTFLQGVLEKLQEAGAANVRIDHATDRWMVVVVDAK